MDRLRAVGTGQELNREQERSLWLHRALLTNLLTDPDATLRKARESLDIWQGKHRETGMTAHWMRLRRETLDGGVGAVAEVLTSHSQRAVELRQNSPFAGVVDQAVRAQVLNSFAQLVAQHWRREHRPKTCAA